MAQHVFADILLDQGVRILVDRSATHNVIDINFAGLVGMMERRISTTILVGNKTEINCNSAAYNVPLQINTESFHIDALLVDIGNDIDVILGTPWLADISTRTWNFTSLEMQFSRNGYTVKLSGIQDSHPHQTILALPTPSTIQPHDSTMASRHCK